MIALPSTPRLALYSVAGAAILAALTWAWLEFASLRRDAARLPQVERENAALVETIKIASEETARNARIANDYAAKVAALRADLRARPITVRVCPKSPETVLPPRTAPRTDASAPGPVAGPPAQDARTVDLTPYAEDAAGCADQLRALQRWVRERP